MMIISVDCDPQLTSPNVSLVEEIAHRVIELNKIASGEVSIIFGSDQLLSSLKKEFFHKDQWTDVITFRLNDYDEKELDGEIYISLPRAKENATSFNEPYEKEVTRLIIHGFLHLLGFDDESDEEKKEMTKLENEFLNQTNWQNLFET
jgi:probable rRNA maturation factor